MLFTLPLSPARRVFLSHGVVLALGSMHCGSHADEAGWAALRQPGAIALFRHANAPGVGDPAGMRLGDCSTQRNLDEAGRAQAMRLAQQFRERGIAVGRVLSSRWCRATETARLAFGGLGHGITEEPAFDSTFGVSGRDEAQVARARAVLRQWKGPGALVVVTHQVNIRALTDISTTSAEGLVVLMPEREGPLRVLGRVSP